MSRYLKPANAALVISILALIAAVVVPAVAQVATTSLSKKEKRLIRKLARRQANKLITKRAPHLSVKRAQTADTANTAQNAVNSQNATNADKVDGFDVGCPGGTLLIAGICFETQNRPAASSLSAAIKDCADEGRYIATLTQLAALGEFVDLDHEYTSSLYVDEAAFKVAAISRTNTGLGISLGIANAAAERDHPYRCATGPVG
jgi:hypothetical protein